VHTEDHPLDYGNFQGTIPEGNYGAGSIQLWDQGTYQVLESGDFEEQYSKGDLKLSFYGQRLQGSFALVRTSTPPNWLWIKKKDAFVRPNWDPENLEALQPGSSLWESQPCQGEPAPMPDWIAPMLARASPPFSDPAYAFEIKWDGYRALAFGQAGKLRLLSRQGNSLLRQLPELQGLGQAVGAREFILDGEVVCLDEQGTAQFQRLQSRAQAGQATQVNRLAQSHPATYYAFDLLYLDGYDLRPLPWHLRRHLLTLVLRPNPWLRLSDSLDGEGEALFELVQLRGLEGIVAKRRDSPYRSGRSGDWLKIKISEEVDCVIGGQTEPEGGREFFGSLVLGLYRGGQLHHVGNVGSGFSADELARVARLLEPLANSQCPFVLAPAGCGRWLRPEQVCKVRYNTRTESGILRAPVYAGLVEGADPAGCLWDEEETASEEPWVAPADPSEQVVDAAGRRLKLTHMDKLLFPQDGFTKGDVLRYYEEIAEFLLPHLKDRPLSLKRYPDGIEADFFFQKRAYYNFPAWLPTYPLENSRGMTVETPLCNDRASLLFLVNLGCIDHNPWLSRIGSLDEPDFMMLDLDPAECQFARLVEGALAVKQLLDELGLASFPKTSGSRGFHIYVPVAAGYEFELTRTMAHLMARVLADRHPNLFTLLRSPARRAADRVYLDAPQNRRGATTAGPYVIRAVAGATVSTPLHWEEVGPDLNFRAFTLRSAPARFHQMGDLLAPLLHLRQPLEAAIERLGQIVGGGNC
jgi:bifunctional non-homologous end joining protein LigD